MNPRAAFVGTVLLAVLFFVILGTIDSNDIIQKEKKIDTSIKEERVDIGMIEKDGGLYDIVLIKNLNTKEERLDTILVRIEDISPRPEW